MDVMAGAPTDYSEAFDFYLTCFICQYSFNSTSRRPLALFCGHTFCSACVPNFKKVFGQLNCPIDHINEVRSAETIPANQLLLAHVQSVELPCLYHPQNSADFFAIEDFEAICETCTAHFPGKQIRDLKDLGNVTDVLVRKIEELSRTAGLMQRLNAHSAYMQLLQKYRTVDNKEKMRLVYALQDLGKGLDPSVRRVLPPLPPPPPPVFTHFRQLNDGSWEIDRFNRILPALNALAADSKQWWISNTGRQVDSVVVMVNRRIQLLGIGLCKEVSPSPQTNIAFLEVLRGATTQSPSMLREYVNTAYSGSDSQVQRLPFSKPIPLSPGEKVTIKVKQNGKGLFFGDPANRNDPLIGPEDLIFSFDDPNYMQQDLQSGQNKWAGPIVRLYFKLL